MKINDQGIDPNRFIVIPRTLIFLFDSDDRILLIKGSPKKKRWAGVYNGIGGHIEPNENILDAAGRELYEETGIKEGKLYLCGQVMISNLNNPGIALFIFNGFVEKTEVRSSREGELHWIPIQKVNEFPLVDDLRVLLPLVAKHQQGDPIIIGKYIENQQDGDLEFLFQCEDS